VLGPGENLPYGAVLDDASALENGYGIRELADQRKVVGDEQVRQPQLVLQAEEQVDEAGLHGDVQRRGRLVQDDDVRPQHQRPGDRDPLALTARQLGWAAGQHGLGQSD
jgi:hypothetical protein